MIAFDLTAEQKQLRQTARDFTAKEIIPVAGRYDEAEEFPTEVLRKAWDVGLMNLEIPAEYGGGRFTSLQFVLAVHALAPGTASAPRQPRLRELGEQLRDQLVAFIQHLREQDMKKLPAISETLDWARALVLLHADSLEQEQVADTLNLVLKTEQDVTLARELLPAWLRKLGKR